MKKNKKIIALFSALIFSTIFSLLIKWIQTGNPFKAETVLYGTVIFLNILILGSIAYQAFQKYSKKPASQLKKNILPLFLLFVFVALIISLLLVSIGVYIFYHFKELNTSNFISQLFRVELPEALRQFSIWIFIGSAFFFYIIWRKAIEREQNLREENLQYKYQNLKSQVNPHFLFNSLNTLSELIYEDAEKADQYIQELSKIYRYILDHEGIDMVPLNKEIDFLIKYFKIQKIRDNDKILLEIDIPNAGRYQVIPVSLQILVENALKHNARSKNSPLKIGITRDNNNIVVSNNICRKNILESSTKTGLFNLQKRVKHILGRDLLFKEENKLFIVKLPILKP